MTAGVEDISEESCPEKMADSAPRDAPKAMVMITDFATASFALLIFFAPNFGLFAIEKQR